jgi:hypothetical protein
MLAGAAASIQPHEFLALVMMTSLVPQGGNKSVEKESLTPVILAKFARSIGQKNRSA